MFHFCHLSKLVRPETYGPYHVHTHMEKKCKEIIYTYSRVQRLMNIKISKAYRTTSHEALCTLTGLTSIVIKAEETAQVHRITRDRQNRQLVYRITRDRQNRQLDHEEEPKHWTHPADSESACKTKKRNTRFTFLQMEARTNTESDWEPLYASRINEHIN